MILLVVVLTVEHNEDAFHNEAQWKEFKFDLTQIPQGEMVTAAEFRIFKGINQSFHGNMTLHITIYQVLQEFKDRLVYIIDTNTVMQSIVHIWGMHPLSIRHTSFSMHHQKKLLYPIFFSEHVCFYFSISLWPLQRKFLHLLFMPI